jgi:acyl carrier protein
MWFGGNGPRPLKSSSGMTRAEIASAVEQIVAAVADEYGLVEAKDAVTLRSSLHDDLGMDEVDLIEVMFRAEERFGLVLPDNDIGPSTTVSNIVDLIVGRLREQEATLAQVINAVRKNAAEVEAESVLISPDQAPSIAEFKDMGDMPHLVLNIVSPELTGNGSE